MQRRPGRTGGGGGFVRIIGGDWRGRKIPVADVPGLRPSGDRGRETLFNWLQGSIHGARCADLFAGTGVLGFEAASRGAKSVTLIEQHRLAADVLRDSARLLKAEQVEVIEDDAIAWLGRQAEGSVDMVFVDPPFDSELAHVALKVLGETGGLSENGLVYLESPRPDSIGTPAGWVQVREKAIGDVRMQLLSKAQSV